MQIQSLSRDVRDSSVSLSVATIECNFFHKGLLSIASRSGNGGFGPPCPLKKIANKVPTSAKSDKTWQKVTTSDKQVKKVLKYPKSATKKRSKKGQQLPKDAKSPQNYKAVQNFLNSSKKGRKGQKGPKSAKKCQKVPTSAQKGGNHCIGATINTHQEIQCLLYAGFFANN